VEGHERHLFLGARNLLAAGVLGVETETSFATSVVYPEAAFGLIQALLIKHGLVMSDLNFNRVRRENYQKAGKLRRLPELPVVGAGKPATFNVLFCRDLVAELNGSVFYENLPPSPGVDQILKLIVIYEVHCMNDIAVDIAMTFSNELGQRLDVERAIDLLCDNVAESARAPIEESAAAQIWDATNILALRQALERLQQELVGVKNANETLSADNARLNRELHELLGSTSWRITKPLRAIKDSIRSMMD